MGKSIEKYDVGKFIANCFYRIFPMFILGALLTFVAESFNSSILGNRASSYVDSFQTILSVSSLEILHPEEYNWHLTQGAYWPLITELDFYLIVAGIVALGFYSTKAVYIPLTLALWASYLPDSEVKTFCLSWPFFSFGMSIYIMERHKTCIPFISTIFAIIFLVFQNMHSPSLDLKPRMGLNLLFILAICLSVIKFGKHQFFQRSIFKPIRLIGLIFYPIFIIHQEGNITG